MPESHLPLPDDVNSLELYPEWRDQFQHDLQKAGLQSVEKSVEADWWKGYLTVGWISPVNGEYLVNDHLILIELPTAFPFEKPRVYPLDKNPPVRSNRHQTPNHDHGPFCLWLDDTTDWRPGTTADALIGRIREWFVHFHQNDWPEQDRSPDLHLYLPSKSGHTLMLFSDDWQPSLDTVSGRFGIWQKDNDSRWSFAGAPIVNTGPVPLNNEDRVLKLLGYPKRRIGQVGVWFRLQREPHLYQHLDSMLVEIDKAANQDMGWAAQQLLGLYGKKVPKTTYAVMALGYPDTKDREHWLFLWAELSSAASNNRWQRPEFIQSVRVNSYEAAAIGCNQLARRIAHISTNLSNLHVLILGQGAIGGSVALLLAKAGLPHLHIVDSDKLKPGNVVRHVAGMPLIGLKKTDAVEWEIRNHAPDCQVTSSNATWEIAKLREWVKAADIIVDATANQNFSALLNEICIKENRTAIYVTAHRRASIGRIRLVRPGRDACLSCYEVYLDIPEYPLIPTAYDEGGFIEEGCGSPTTEASAVDLEPIAAQTARATLWYLQNKLEKNNHCLLVNDFISNWQELLSQPGIYWSEWQPIPSCPVCKS